MPQYVGVRYLSLRLVCQIRGECRIKHKARDLAFGFRGCKSEFGGDDEGEI